MISDYSSFPPLKKADKVPLQEGGFREIKKFRSFIYDFPNIP